MSEPATRIDRVESLFHAALEQAASARTGFLESACDGDDGLRHEVEGLLAAHSRIGAEFLQPKPHELDLSGRRIGGFSLIRVLGAGGMGVVYDAEQDRPRRRVALKVLHALPGLERDVRRFRFEAEVMAGLSHPNIAQVYEVGTVDEPGGRLAWFAMELVEGACDLITYAREEKLDLEDRLALFDQVCRGVQHGHGKGVLHRDLKPDNILVERSGRIKIIDFGVARLMEPSARRGTLLTRAGDVVGTPMYMSPEQCSGDEPDIRADVYSLGVMLYELLTGVRAFDLSSTPVSDVLDILRREDPAPPSRHRRELRGDLETIVLTALAKDKGRRYPTVEALAEDLRRFRAHEPILARPPGPAHAMLLFARRHRVFLIATALVVTGLTVAVALATAYGLRAESARALAERRAYVATLAAASGALRSHDGGEALAQLERAPPGLRGWEWRHLLARSDVSERAVPWPNAFVLSGAVSAASPYVAAAATSPEATVRVWNTETGEVVLTIPRDLHLATSCALSPNGDRLVVGYHTGIVEVRSLPSGEVLHEGPQEWEGELPIDVWAIAFDREGTRFATASINGLVRVRSLSDGSILTELRAHEGGAYSIVFAPSGERLYTGGAEDRTIRAFDPTTGEEVLRAKGHAGNVESLAINPAGTRLVSGSMDGTVRMWDARTLAPIGEPLPHALGVKSVAFAPDGRTFASGSLDNTVRLFNAEDLGEIACLVGHATRVRMVGYSADARRVVSLSRTGVRVWDVERLPASDLVGPSRFVRDLFLGGDGTVRSLTAEGELSSWDALSGRRTGHVPAQDRGEAVALFTDRGESFVVARPSGSVTLHRTSDGELLREMAVLGERPSAIAATPDGSHVIVGDDQGGIASVALAGGPATRWRVPTVRGVVSLAVHPSRNRVASGCGSGELSLWSLDAALITETFLEANDVARSLAFTPSPTRLVVGCRSGAIRILDAETLEQIGALMGHSGAVADLALSPDGRRLASASIDGTVRIWEPEWGQQLLVLRGHPVHVTSVAWSDDGSTLLSGGGDHFPEACGVRTWGTLR